MRILYDIIFLIFGIFYLPVLLFKGKLHSDFPQKFGALPEEVTSPERPVWIHAVSVGEAVLGAKLAKAIKDRFPSVPVVVSTTTRTGNNMIRKEGKGFVDAVFYYPFDLRAVVSKVVREVDPALYIMVETELWPNLLEELRRRDIPVLLANGRISEASFRNYRKISFVTGRLLRCIDRFCMQSPADAERIKALGAPGERVSVTGNMKFDEEGRHAGAADMTRASVGFSGRDRIIVAGSTHFPEEQMMIDIYGRLSSGRDDLKLILAPRHVERADAINVYIDKAGMGTLRFSDALKGKRMEAGGREVLLVDTIGHLKQLYSLADLVFIGGSIAKKGGQNPIEAARWEKAVVFGPNMSNFREVAEIFLEEGAALMARNAGELEKMLRDLLENEAERAKLARKAAGVISGNSGAVGRTVSETEKLLKK